MPQERTHITPDNSAYSRGGRYARRQRSPNISLGVVPLAPVAREAPFGGGIGATYSSHRLTLTSGLCQYRHVTRDEGSHVACRFPFQSEVVPGWHPRHIGYALYVAQLGQASAKAKPLQGFGGQVMEVAAYDASGTYRAVYTVSIGQSIVIHAFQKKSKSGNRDAEIGDGTDPAAAQAVEKRGEECRKKKRLNASLVQATYSLTSASS